MDTSPDGAAELVVAGYAMCRTCGDWFVPRDGHETVGMCNPCARKRFAEDEAKRIEYEVEGRRFITRAQKQPQPTRQGNRAEYWRLWNRARQRALARLAQIDKPMFEMLMSEEKIKVGLKPGFDRRNPRTAATTRQITELAEQDE